jgi:DNA-binding CsgD family transcriptional regulator
MKTTNPWNITPSQGASLSALAEHGCGKRVARELGIEVKTVESHVYDAKRLMGKASRIQAVVAWDRYSREMAKARPRVLLGELKAAIERMDSLYAAEDQQPQPQG